ncbi:MAG: peptidase domain-containing ABC transporter [Muribaculum sp.]|nr:peptidase domain-containing ABC transporter [Muribaculum sp.]
MHVYQQLEFSDCGYACVRMICRHYGWRIAPDYLREISDYNRLGLSIGEIKSILTHLGFNCQAVKVSIDEVSLMPLPSILFWKEKHFVVLASIDPDKYEILDPAEGRLYFKKDEFVENFISSKNFGVALVMEDTPKFYEQKTKINRYERNNGLLPLIKKSYIENKKYFRYICLLTVIALTADITIPFIFQKTIDEGISSRDVNLVWLLVAGQLFVFLGGYISNAIIEILLTKLGLKMSIDMLNKYLSKLVKLPMSFYARKVNSDLIQKAEDHNRIKNFLLSVPNTLLSACIVILVFSCLLLYFSPLIFCLFFLFTFASMLWTTYFLKYRRVLDSSVIAKISENRNNLYELIEGIEEIKTNNAHNTKVKGWHTLQDKINQLSIKSTFLKLYQSGGNSFLIRLRDIIIMGICASLVIQEQMTIGIMMTVSYIVGRLSLPFSAFFESINDVQDAKMSYNRIEEIHNTNLENGETVIDNEDYEIKLNNVSFKYPGSNSKYILQNLSLDIPYGKTVALVGSSGSGKSTIIRLIANFYKPQLGEVLIGNIDLSKIIDSEWTKHVSVVLQNGKIFSGSILSNIALADEKPDVNKAIEACKIACIDDFVTSLPLGIYSRIGKTGLDISGGQQQRILIARAIYRNPQILILDEATSSLDAITEAKIMNNIFSKFETRTLIIAAHRLSTIRNADSIFVINNGKIVENGTHDDLILRGGDYFNLVNKQI